MNVRYVTSTGVIMLLATLPLLLYGQTAEQLQRQIDDSTGKIQDLDADIKKYQQELDSVASKKKTLQSTIDELNLSIKKTNALISKSKQQIQRTQLEIQQLGKQIGVKESSIDTGTASLAEWMRKLTETTQMPLVVSIFSSNGLSDIWQKADAYLIVQQAVAESIRTLDAQRKSLEDTKSQTEKKRSQLVKEQNALLTQQQSLAVVKKAQGDLLSQTKAQESNYQKILAQKKAAKSAFEAVLYDLQSQLKLAVDPASIPKAGKGILQWPVDSVRITQYFGDTEFSRSGAYNGKGHNGIDLAAPIGTPLKAALTGTVVDTGNTDAVRGCYSFGKWVMLKHANGLNTMYSHLSQINVTKGESVSTGQVIGYSGETGYATGPHLHFGVYLSSATKIVRLGDQTSSKTPCANAVMPVAPLAAYLDPMKYL